MLHQHGIKCVTESDGPGMMSVGWTLWDVWGLVEHQAWDFLYDGYTNWTTAGATPAERVPFVRAVFDRLQTIQPEVAPSDDVWSLPPAVASPASRYYGSRCWAASELLVLAEATSTLTPELETELYDSLSKVNEAFMPPRTLHQYKALADAYGPSVDR